ncbi:MAG: HNH endonuclease signature motif containing protein [Nocardioidaceae bacterium]
MPASRSLGVGVPPPARSATHRGTVSGTGQLSCKYSIRRYRAPGWCESHHITAWSRGGPTDLTNGCLLCTWHHHLLHKGEWAIVMATDGVPEIIPPTRIDPHQQPLRHQRFHRSHGRRRQPGRPREPG